MKQKIEGVIVFNVDNKKYEFTEYPKKDKFKDGVYVSDYLNFVFVREHTIEFESGGVDLVKPQLNSLDAKEKELTIQYNQALQHIKVQRNNLLAITND